MNKAKINLAFENCSIPAVLEFVALLPNRFVEQIALYSYRSDLSKENCFYVNEASNLQEFIWIMQHEQERVYQLIADDKVDPESHDIDYAFAATFED